MRALAAHALTCQLVGVGEKEHGELGSWPTRLRLLHAAVSAAPRGKPVVVFMEQLHPFLAAMNAHGGRRFDLATEPGRFHPYIIHGANMSAEHLALHRRLRRWSAAGRVRFVGVDVHVVAFPGLWAQLPPGDVALDALVRRTVERHGAGFVGSGSVMPRNVRNVAILKALMRALGATTARPFFYWAHNSHVARDQVGTSDAYRLDGSMLGPVPQYLSVLTYSPRMWQLEQSLRQRLVQDDSPRVRRQLLERRRTWVAPGLPPGVPILGRQFRTGDADWFVISCGLPPVRHTLLAGR